MKRPLPRAATIRAATIAVGLALPTLTLVPLGSIWLWQNGYLLHWAIASAGIVGVVFAAQRWLLRPVARDVEDGEPPVVAQGPDGDDADPMWAPAEQQAWEDVLAIARRIRPEELATRDAILTLGGDTVKAVARRLHPEVSEPLWQFTAPEAFALLERISRRLGDFTDAHVPLSDRLTVAQVMAVYRWRGALDVAEKAYDVWRMVRLANPMTAATHEIRERLSRHLLQLGRDHLGQQLASAYVREVGRAAIDLYGGRLKVSARAVSEMVSTNASRDAGDIERQMTEPLRILVAGQIGSGKSSLVNALARETLALVDVLPVGADFTAHQLKASGFPAARLIDAPGLTSDPASLRALVEQAVACDLVLWTVAAHRADRAVDRQALAELSKAISHLRNRSAPPIVLVVTHIDRLRPVAEWSPPYDISSASNEKARSIRDAVEAIGGELGAAAEELVPVSLVPSGPYNVETVWARMSAVLPDAQRARLVRMLSTANGSWDWRRVWRQAAGAGRLIGRTLRR